MITPHPQFASTWNAHVERSEMIFRSLLEPGTASFAEMAVALRVQAHDAAFQLDYASDFANIAGTDGIRRAAWELASRARMIGCAHLLLKELIPHEAAVRALLVPGREAA